MQCINRQLRLARVWTGRREECVDISGALKELGGCMSMDFGNDGSMYGFIFHVVSRQLER